MTDDRSLPKPQQTRKLNIARPIKVKVAFQIQFQSVSKTQKFCQYLTKNITGFSNFGMSLVWDYHGIIIGWDPFSIGFHGLHAEFLHPPEVVEWLPS